MILRRFITTKVDWTNLKFTSKVPQMVVKSVFPEITTRIEVSVEEIKLLEKLSLVDLERK